MADDRDDPQLRHEFVGMMFAIAVGEIGLQTAGLVQAGHKLHFLPAYAHLSLATFLIAASWVGWSRSRVAGARRDVHGIFEWAFVVLLLDMTMVVTYFILVRTVNFEPGEQRIAPASEVAFWHVVIFALYLIWDIVTKVLMYEREKGISWFRQNGIRILPTVACLIASEVVRKKFLGADPVHWLSADFALLSLVMLFRALKGLAPLIWPPPTGRPGGAGSTVLWVIACAAGLVVGTMYTVYSWPLPLPGYITSAIQNPLPH